MIDRHWLNDHRDRLSAEFERDGFVSVPDFFDADEVVELRTNLECFIETIVPSMPAAEVYYEDPGDAATLKQLQQIWKRDAFFGEMMAAGSKLTTLAEIVLGEGVRPKNMQYFNKPAGRGQPTPPHQDGYFFHLKPNRAVTIWFALEDVAPEQGPVNYVKGSHRDGMRSHSPSNVLGFSQSIPDFGTESDRSRAISFPCRAGHLIAHDSLTIHWADGNSSADKSRQAMGAIFYGETAQEDVEAKADYEARLAQQLAGQGKI